METVDNFTLIEFVHVKWSFMSTFELIWLLLNIDINIIIIHYLHVISISVNIQLTLWSSKAMLLSLNCMETRWTLLWNQTTILV